MISNQKRILEISIIFINYNQIIINTIQVLKNINIIMDQDKLHQY